MPEFDRKSVALMSPATLAGTECREMAATSSSTDPTVSSCGSPVVRELDEPAKQIAHVGDRPAIVMMPHRRVLGALGLLRGAMPGIDFWSRRLRRVGPNLAPAPDPYLQIFPTRYRLALLFRDRRGTAEHRSCGDPEC